MGGGSTNWFKSLVPVKKSNPLLDQEKMGKKGRKWKLWRASSDTTGFSVKSGPLAPSEASDIGSLSVAGGDFYSAAMATLIRAPPREFFIVRQEWAALRIQTTFRAFLAKRAFRALKALVRLQAIVRGRLVRKQAAMTLKCMQALVRAQAHVKAHRIRVSLEGQSSSVQNSRENKESDPVKQAEEGWCDRRGSVEEVRTKLQMRQEAVSKRERALAYAISQQRFKSSPNLNPSRRKDTGLSTTATTSSLNKSVDKNTEHVTMSWLDKWMASKPWENRLLMEEAAAAANSNSDRLHDLDSPVLKNNKLLSSDRPKTKTTNTTTTTTTRVKANNNKKSSISNSTQIRNDYDDDDNGSHEKFTTSTRRNNMTRRVFARPPTPSSSTFGGGGESSSISDSEQCSSKIQKSVMMTTTATATTSTSTRTTPVSTEEGTDESSVSKPRYMNHTASNKAKQRGGGGVGAASSSNRNNNSSNSTNKPSHHRVGSVVYGKSSIIGRKIGEEGRISVDLAAAAAGSGGWNLRQGYEDLYPTTTTRTTRSVAAVDDCDDERDWSG